VLTVGGLAGAVLGRRNRPSPPWPARRYRPPPRWPGSACSRRAWPRPGTPSTRLCRSAVAVTAAPSPWPPGN